MSTKIKKIILALLAVAIVVGAIVALIMGGDKTKTTAKYKVVASNFANYDFLRAVIGDNEEIELTFLLGPGKDAHSYDPTAQDLIKIQDSNLFVYVGGEMEKWAEKVIESIDVENTEVVCISDYVEKVEEKEIDGAEEHEEDHDHTEGAFDEHIWTSPENAIKMVDALAKAMEKIDTDNASKYKENAENYIEKINKVDKQIKEIIDNKKRDRLVFADKMPMQYFIDYYNLQVTAAFDGCSTEVDPSAKTVAYLQTKVKEEKIPVILYIELNPGIVAETIATETGAKAMQIQTLHNITLEDFNNGETWVSLMTRNIDILREALQ